MRRKAEFSHRACKVFGPLNFIFYPHKRHLPSFPVTAGFTGVRGKVCWGVRSISRYSSQRLHTSPFRSQTSLPRSCHANLIPRAFSSFKMAVGETPGQGCWNTPRIVEYFVTWHMMKWLFLKLSPASGGPVCFPPFWTRRRPWGRGWCHAWPNVTRC